METTSHQLPPGVGIALGLAALALGVLWLAYWLFPRYRYEITDDSVVMRRWVLAMIPLGRCVIPLRDIQEVRRLGFPSASVIGAVLFGRFYSTSGVLLILRPGAERFRMFWKVYVTPESPEAFVAEVRERIGAYGGGPPSERSRHSRHGQRSRGWLWLGDIVASLSWAGVVLAAVALLRARPWSPGLVRVYWLAGPALTVMWMWMWVDSLVQSARDPANARRRAAWIGIVTLLVPGPWAYYLLVWRQRRSGGNGR
jgi:hypothetical protein